MEEIKQYKKELYSIFKKIWMWIEDKEDKTIATNNLHYCIHRDMNKRLNNFEAEFERYFEMIKEMDKEC